MINRAAVPRINYELDQELAMLLAVGCIVSERGGAWYRVDFTPDEIRRYHAAYQAYQNSARSFGDFLDEDLEELCCGDVSDRYVRIVF